MTAIGFIGLGHMGKPMALNLLKAGYTVHVFDVVPQAAKALVDHGAISHETVADVAQASEVVITSVQTGNQVKSVCLGDQGIFAHMQTGRLYIDCSSIDISTTRELHQLAEQRGLVMLDAPVSGGVAGAEQGSLTFMVGGHEHGYHQAEPILKNMGKKIVHAGGAGSGQAAKICNNLLLAISMVGVSEAFSLANKLNLDPKKFFEISSSSSGQCWSMTSYCPVPGVLEHVPSSHDYEPGFMAKMMLKDLRLAHHAAEAVDSPIPLGSLVTELYELYVNQGHGEKDFSGIINLLTAH